MQDVERPGKLIDSPLMSRHLIVSRRWLGVSSIRVPWLVCGIFADAGNNQLALKIGQPARHGQHKPPVRGHGVGKGLKPGFPRSNDTRSQTGKFLKIIRPVI